MAKPKYIIEIETRMDGFEKNQADMKEDQDKILIRTGEIHTALMGTEYDRANPNGGKGGGLVKRLTVVEKCVSTLDRWKDKVITRDAVIWIFLSAILGGIWTVLLLNWETIFNHIP